MARTGQTAVRASADGESGATIGAATRVSGRVTGDGDVTVYGAIDGTVAIRGELVVQAGAKVEGESFEADAVTIAGTVTGNLRAPRGVRAMAGSRVRGDVTGPIAIDDGADFAGAIEIDFDLPPELLEGVEPRKTGRR